MGVKLSSIAADLQKEAEGEWVPIEEWGPGVALLVRSINLKAFQDAREQRFAKLARDLGRGPTTSEFRPILAQLAASHLLIGWKGICGDDEQPLEYTPEIAMTQMVNPAMHPLVTQVIWAAGRVGVRAVEFTDAAVKNS